MALTTDQIKRLIASVYAGKLKAPPASSPDARMARAHAALERAAPVLGRPEDTSDLDALIAANLPPITAADSRSEPTAFDGELIGYVPHPREMGSGYPGIRPSWPAIVMIVAAAASIVAYQIYGLQESRRAVNEYRAMRAEAAACTQDCSGHRAGYAWAEKNEISALDDCGGNSQSFINGCKTYVYGQMDADDYR